MTKQKENTPTNTKQPKAVRPIKKRDYRHTCGRLLFRGYMPPGTDMALRCPKCSGMFTLKLAKAFDEYMVVEPKGKNDG